MRLPPILCLVAMHPFACNAIIDIRERHWVASVESHEPPAANEATTTIIPPMETGCGDLSRNPVHCGRCGHSCLGGSCVAGNCQPVALAEGIRPRRIALGQGIIVWLENVDGRVAQMNKDGAEQVVLWTQARRGMLPENLNVDDSYVYWTNDEHEVSRCAIGGCGGAPTVLAKTDPYPSSLGVDASHLYWIERGSDESRVVRMPKSGGPREVIGHATGVRLVGLALDATHIYTASAHGHVYRFAKERGALQELGGSTGEGATVLVDDQSVYWSTWGQPAAIYAMPKDGSLGPYALAASLSYPLGIAIDARSLFWTMRGVLGADDNGSILMRDLTSGGESRVLADRQHDPTDIAVDEAAVYWVNDDFGGDEGGVFKLARP